jgi:hypothetical protein
MCSFAILSLGTDVVEIVAVKALWNHSEPQRSIRRPQRIQLKPVRNVRFKQISITS